DQAGRLHREGGANGSDTAGAECGRVIGETPDDRGADAEEESFQLNDELARRLREISCARLRDDEDVLEADTADDRVVDTGLDRHDVAGEERLRARSRDRRRFVDL